MKESIVLILKGFIIGTGKIIPGVSGSLIALSLGLYEQAIESISNIFKNFKSNAIFLSTIGIGVLCSIILGSNLISYFLNKYYMITMFLFIGLIMGSITDIKKKLNKKDYFIVGIILLISLFLFSFSSNETYTFNQTVKDYLYLFIIGFIDAATMVIPGISGTAIFMLMGCYNELLYIFGNIINIFFSNPLIIMMLGLGVIIGIILTSKLMNYLFKNNGNLIYSIILGFSISSVCYLFIRTFYTRFMVMDFFVGIVFLILGYVITRFKMNNI